VNNYICFFADLMATQHRKVVEMLADETLLLTFHASLLVRNNIYDAVNYTVQHIDGKRYNVTRIGHNEKHQRVDYPKLTCTCGVPRLCGVPCQHLCAIYLLGTQQQCLGSQHFVSTFSSIIPDYYKKEGYARGYDKGTCRPIMTCVLDDDTLPPPMERTRVEGGFKKKRPPNPVAQTKKNMNNTMDDALLAEKEKPAIVLRQLRGTGYSFGHGQPEDMSLLYSVADLIGSALISTGNAFKTRQGRQG
jgi:hypothetical protein